MQLYVWLSNAVNFLIFQLFRMMIYYLIWANLTNLILVVSKMQSPVTLVFQVQDGASMVQRRARTSSIKLKGISLYFKAFFQMYQMALYFCRGCGKTHTGKFFFSNSMNRKVFDIVMCVVNNNFQYCKKVSIFQVFNLRQYFFVKEKHMYGIFSSCFHSGHCISLNNPKFIFFRVVRFRLCEFSVVL